jgi:hypothetical protein
VAYLHKVRIVGPAEAAVAREPLCKQTPVAKQWLSDRHVIAATVAHATIAELLEEVISVRSATVLYTSNSNLAAMKSQLRVVSPSRATDWRRQLVSSARELTAEARNQRLK